MSRKETSELVKAIEGARTPTEKFYLEMDKLEKAYQSGAIKLDVYERLLGEQRKKLDAATAAAKKHDEAIASGSTSAQNAVVQTASLASSVGDYAIKLGTAYVSLYALRSGIDFVVDSGVSFIAHMKSTQDAIDDVADSANKLGVSYNELTGLRFSGQEGGGLDAGTVDASIRKMLVNISKAVDDPASPINQAFKRLGVNAGELMKAGPTEAVMKLADGMQGINNQADKLALAMEIFGKSGIEMVTTLEGGRDAIAESVDFQNKWNGLTDAQVVAVQASNDAWDRIGVVIGGVSTKLSAEMAPAFLVIAESVLQTASELDSIDEAMQMVVNTSAYYIGQLKDIAELFIAMPMALTGVGDTSFAFDLSSGQKAMQAVIDKRMELEGKAIKDRTLLDIDAVEKVSDTAYNAMIDRVLSEEQKRIDMENRLARNALQAAEKVFEKQRSDALKLRDEIAKGPGGGIQADSNEAAKFMADQVNKALASDSVGVPGKPTDEMLLEEARRQYEQALIDSKKTDEQTDLLKKLLEKQPLARAR